MIDDPAQVEALLAEMNAQRPLPALTTRALAAMLQQRSPGLQLPRRCQVTDVNYAGDEGGILCRLDFGLDDAKEAYVVSITHLAFERRVPLSRDIELYQKRRTKRLKRLGPSSFS